jgi:phage shock protein A
MFKKILTLLRGSANAAGGAVIQRNALVLLDQQIRDAGTAIQSAQRALAFAIAEDRQETQRIGSISSRILGLEDRARAALAGNRDDLALLAAETIAELEMDRDAATQAQALICAEISRLRQVVNEAGRRFAELQRGRRLARVGDAVTRSRLGGVKTGVLRDAEQNLAALRNRQVIQATAQQVLDDMAPEPGQLEERLGQAGFGPALRPNAASVLARLKPLAITQS